MAKIIQKSNPPSSDNLARVMLDFDDLPNSKLLPELTAAALLDLSPKTLSSWALNGNTSLRYVRVGSNRKYRCGDIRSFIAANTFNHTGEESRIKLSFPIDQSDS